MDPTWQADADDEVLALALAEGTLYVGGTFATIGGQPRNQLAALDAATGTVTPWDPALAYLHRTPEVRALVVARDVVYVAGGFDDKDLRTQLR